MSIVSLNPEALNWCSLRVCLFGRVLARMENLGEKNRDKEKWEGVWLGGEVKNFVMGPNVFFLDLPNFFFSKIRIKLKGENIGSSNNQIFPTVHWVTFSNFPCVFVFFKLFGLTFTLLFIFQRFNQTVDFAFFLFFDQRWGPWWLSPLFFINVSFFPKFSSFHRFLYI